MTYPEDVLKAAREAAARYWDTLDAADSGEGYDENARLCRSGECDADPEVQSACIAIMAERERCAEKALYGSVMAQGAMERHGPERWAYAVDLAKDITDAILGPESK